MRDKLTKILAYVRGLFLRRKIRVEGWLKSYGCITIMNNGGVIRIGKRSALWSGVKLSLSSVVDGKTPVIQIGSFSSIGDRTQIHCADSVSIGNYVLISWDVNILEFDYHASGGGPALSAPIVIEDEVWIGVRCIILKGVTIGKGSIIGAGAVVTKDIPAYTFAAGNPARPIKSIASWCGSTAESESVQ